MAAEALYTDRIIDELGLGINRLDRTVLHTNITLAAALLIHLGPGLKQVDHGVEHKLGDFGVGPLFTGR